jgi:hypothetical protein
MDYTIYPYEGVGQIRFGMTPQQVHEILGEPDDQFPASKRCDLPADIYDRLNLFIYYKHPNSCEAVELFVGSNPSFQETLLLDHSMQDLKSWLLLIGSDIQYSTSGFISFKYGLSFYSSYYNPQLLCHSDSACVFERGYFDKMSEVLSRYPKEVVKA